MVQEKRCSKKFFTSTTTIQCTKKRRNEKKKSNNANDNRKKKMNKWISPFVINWFNQLALSDSQYNQHTSYIFYSCSQSSILNATLIVPYQHFLSHLLYVFHGTTTHSPYLFPYTSKQTVFMSFEWATHSQWVNRWWRRQMSCNELFNQNFTYE